MAVQRNRILEATLGLMARGGSHGTSMRAVAAACGLNVATLYHYFPSKRDLLQAAIEHRRAADLPHSPFPEGLAGSVEDRLGALLDHLFVGMTVEEDLWRALIAEAIHGDDDVFEPLLETANAFELALAGWLRSLCPDAPGLQDPAVVGAIRNAVIGVLVEHLPQTEGRRAALEARARGLAHVFARVSAGKPDDRFADKYQQRAAHGPGSGPTPVEET
ncbi:MAG TPA: TetR/AcrR family transcriptional regulator [Acidimicrobiia bacterium]|jgi:AcrR family transcriptional regulator|nr:TetR/AcrR family transcriptional regulator [Acidimicrobiia bacterium]